MAAPIYYTAEMVRALPEDGNKYEVVYGELLATPAPRAWHEEISLRLLDELRPYTRAQGVGHTFGSRSDISWSPDTLVPPDVFVVELEQARTMNWVRMQDLLLAIEVLSPSSLRADRFTKRRLYQAQRIPAYWVVDGDKHAVETWTPEAHFPVVEREKFRWQPVGATEPFTIELAELFRPL